MQDCRDYPGEMVALILAIDVVNDMEDYKQKKAKGGGRLADHMDDPKKLREVSLSHRRKSKLKHAKVKAAFPESFPRG